MAFKCLPRVSKFCCYFSLPTGALIMAFVDLMFMASNVYFFYNGLACVNEYCEQVWLQVVYLAPYAWLALAAVILIITYFDREHTDLLAFAVVIKLVLVVCFLVILILIFIGDELYARPKGGAAFLTLGSAFVFILAYFAVAANSWQADLMVNMSAASSAAT